MPKQEKHILKFSNKTSIL